MKKSILILSLLISASLYSKNFTVGAFATNSNNLFYTDNKVTYMPYLDIRYENFRFSGTELSANVFDHYNLSVDVFADFLDGYSLRASDMKDGYRSINRRRSQVAFGVGATYNLSDYFNGLSMNANFSKGKRGSHGELSLNQQMEIIPNFMGASIGVNGKYFSNSYTKYYFGISEDEVAGNITHDYNPSSATSLGANISLECYLNENISLNAFYKIDRYSKEIRKSPITKDGFVNTVGAGVKFSF